MLSSRQSGIPTAAHRTIAKRLQMLCLLLSVAVLQMGCVAPAVSMKPPAFQQKAVTVRDWDRVAQRIASSMQTHGVLAPDSSGRPSLFYVNVVAKESAFLQEVHDALESELRARDVPVARSPGGATVINLDATFVQWGHGDVGPGGEASLLGAGAAIGYLIADGNRSGLTLAGQAAIALGSGIVFDVLAATLQTTNTEVIWQALVVSGDRVLMRVQQPMYVTASDASLYLGRNTVPIASPGPTVALESVRLRYQQ